VQAELGQPERPAAARNVEEALARLAGIVAAARAGGSAVGICAAVRRQATLRLREAIGSGAFADGARMEALETIAANRFLAAYEAFGSGAVAARCWQLAFTASREDRLVILQNVLLAMSAHIGFDLGVAAAEVCPGEAIFALQGDLDRLAGILGGLLPAAEAAIGRFSPLLGLLEQLGGRSDGEVLHFSCSAALAGAWKQSLVLAQLPPAAWPAALDAFDEKAALLGKLIAEPGGLAAKAVDIIRLTESLDVRAVIDALDSLPAGKP
jgi:hypothetical protein